jgi:hypothetical protein
MRNTEITLSPLEANQLGRPSSEEPEERGDGAQAAPGLTRAEVLKFIAEAPHKPKMRRDKTK